MKGRSDATYAKTLKVVRANVRALRRGRNLHQRQLAADIGTSQAWICYVERGKKAGTKSLNLEFLCRIAEFFKIPVHALFVENSFGKAS